MRVPLYPVADGAVEETIAWLEERWRGGVFVPDELLPLIAAAWLLRSGTPSSPTETFHKQSEPNAEENHPHDEERPSARESEGEHAAPANDKSDSKGAFIRAVMFPNRELLPRVVAA